MSKSIHKSSEETRTRNTRHEKMKTKIHYRGKLPVITRASELNSIVVVGKRVGMHIFVSKVSTLFLSVSASREASKVIR